MNHESFKNKIKILHKQEKTEYITESVYNLSARVFLRLSNHTCKPEVKYKKV